MGIYSEQHERHLDGPLGLLPESHQRLTDLFCTLEELTDDFDGSKNQLTQILETESNIQSIMAGLLPNGYVSDTLACHFNRMTDGPGILTKRYINDAIEKTIVNWETTSKQKSAGFSPKCVLTEDFIAEKMWQHYKKHGSFPRELSGRIDGLPGEFWKGWDKALRGIRQEDGTIHGIRGLPGGSSLYLLSIKQGWSIAQLTEEIIAEKLWQHNQRHGKFADRFSGTVDGSPNEKWSAWDKALQGLKQKNGSIRSIRGLPGGSSLSKFKKADFFHNFIRQKQEQAKPSSPALEAA